jgi:hypothetical protein
VSAPAQQAVRLCKACGNPLPEDARPQKRTCNGPCRAEASRQRRGLSLGRRTERPCEHCGEAISKYDRRDKRFCNSSCKAAACRARQAAKAEIEARVPA